MTQSFRILVADDWPDAADSLAAVLALAGHDARAIYRGDLVLGLVREWRPHVALLDLSLPGADGFALARAIRSELGEAAPRLGAVTGWGQARDRERSRDAGFDRHFTKPVDADEILRWIALPQSSGSTIAP